MFVLFTLMLYAGCLGFINGEISIHIFYCVVSYCKLNYTNQANAITASNDANSSQTLFVGWFIR